MRTVALVMVVGLVGVFAVSGVSSAATAGPDQGVTDTSVKIGFIFPKTGPGAANQATSDAGCNARVGRENAKGGVNGRKIEVVYGDDATNPGTHSTVAQDLVQNKHVFLVVNDSPLASLAYRYLRDSGVGVIDGGFAGNYYGDPGNEKIISAFGNAGSTVGATYDLTAAIAKAKGATKMASLGYGISPSSSVAAENNGKYGAPAKGLKNAYTNTTVDFGSTDVGPIVLGIKNSGADAAYYAMNANTNLAIAQGLAQSGVKMKAEIMATGYGQSLLDSPGSDTIGTDVIFTQMWAPVELKTKATKQLQADLKKYTDYTGVPDFGIYTGYSDCDLAILGLKQQGKNLDQSTFASDLRKIGSFNQGGGLGCGQTDISAESFGKQAQEICSYAMVLKNGKFTLLKPKGTGKDFWTGKLVGKSVTEATTTTTAPPS